MTIRLTEEAFTTDNPQRQLELFKQDMLKMYLMHNKNLIPDLFIKIFFEFKQHTVLDNTYYASLKYNNPETQSLLEKVLLLC